MSSSEAESSSLPANMIEPEIRALPAKRVRPITVSDETLLPEPDSPTMPSARPRSTVYETPSTALTMPSSVVKWTFRSSTSRRGTEVVPHAGVEERVHDPDAQVESDDEERAHEHDALDGVEVALLDG